MPKNKINCIAFSGNNIAKFIDYQILTNTLVLKLKKNENKSVILPTGINGQHHLSGTLVRIQILIRPLITVFQPLQ